MRRKLFPALALFSLLLCGATIWWSRGVDRIDEVTYEKPGVQTVSLWGSDGKVMLTRTTYMGAIEAPARSQLTWGSTPLDEKSASEADKSTLLSVLYDSQALKDKGAQVSTLVMPSWLIAAGFALLPLTWVVLKFKPRKKPAGK